MNYVLLGAMFVHFVADFVCQTPEMAKNKSKSLSYLSYHVAVYTMVMTVSLILYTQFRYELGPNVAIPLWAAFATMIFISHFAVDFVTSRITSIIFESAMNELNPDSKVLLADRKIAFARKYHDYFVVIGFDQFLHFASLLVIIYLLNIQ